MPGQPGLCMGAVSQTSSSPLPHAFSASPSFSPLEPRQPQQAGKVRVWTPALGEGASSLGTRLGKARGRSMRAGDKVFSLLLKACFCSPAVWGLGGLHTSSSVEEQH